MDELYNNKDISLDERVYSEQVKLLYKALPASILANCIAGLLIIRIQWPVIQDTVPVIWLFVFEFFMILRAALYFKYSRTSGIENYRFWGNAFVFASGITGLLWGVAGVIMFPAGNELYQMTLIFCLMAMSAGAVTSHSFLKAPPFIFIFFSTTPLFVRFLFEETSLSLSLGAVLVLSVIYLLMSSNRGVNSAAENIRMRFNAVDKEEEIKNSERAVEKANRAKDEFFSLMNHELRTPLNSILGYGQLLKMGAKDEEAKDNAQEVLIAGNHLLKLINEILVLSKIESTSPVLKFQPVNLNKIIEECLSLIRPLAIERHITITDDISTKTEYMIYSDQIRIKQILINLFSNAVKYNKDGGNIRLHCEEISPGRLRIFVSDSGVGLSEDQQATLFVPFERRNADKKGKSDISIGLHVTKFLLKEMEGDIGVESQLGQGSTFWIEVNLTE